MEENSKENVANILRKHGLAASSMAAEQMASNIVGGRSPNQRYTDIEEAQKVAKETQPAPTAPGLTEEQAINVLQKFTDMFTKELEKMAERINGLEKQLDKIQNNSPQGEMMSAQQMNQNIPPPQEGQQTLSSSEQAAASSMGFPPLEPQAQPTQQTAAMPQQQAPVVQPVDSKPVEEKKENKPSHHPRSAAFDTDKYSVDKIFYSGGR